MKRIKKYIYILICTFCMLISMTPASAASVTGDQSLDPIIMKQKDSVKTAMSKNCGTKYFRVVINEPGILTVKLNSTKLKKNAEIRILHDETGIDYDSQIIKYNKKKKKLSGKMVSSSILMPGQYDIVIKTTDVSKKTAFTLTTSFKAYTFDDIESNNTENAAQEMKVTSSSKKKTYQMMLSGQKNNTDRIDYFTFTLDKKSKIVVSAKADVASNVRIIIKKKTADGYQIINEKENEQYMISNNGKSTFTYKSENLSKGTYYIMVWAPAEETQQICYTINATKGA